MNVLSYAAPSEPSSLRLAVVIESFNPAAGGNERSTAQIMQELVGRGHAVTLITGYCARKDEPTGVTVRAMSWKKSSSVLRLERFARFAQRTLADGMFDASLSMTMAVAADVVQPRGGTIRETLLRNIAMRQPGWPQARKRLELMFDAKQNALLRHERQTLANPRVHRIAAVSEYVARQLRQHYRFPADHIVIIPNAAVMPKISDAQRAQWRADLREQFQIGPGTTLFLLAAQNPSLKGYPTLLAALADPTLAQSDVAVLLVGGFDYAQHQAAAQAGVRERVRIVGQSRQMPALYAAADVTVLPTWYDPSSKVVLESLMMGTPAISTAYNGASDHLAPVGHSARGLVVQDPGDAAELAGAMLRLTDPALRQACRQACAGLAEQLSMARHVDALEVVLREAAAR